MDKTDMGEIEFICFKIISCVGSARSSYIEAIRKAKEGEIEKARELISEGENVFNEGHNFHNKLIQNEAAGQKNEFSLLLMHAEDMLMSAETFRITAEEFIDIYERISKLNI